MTKKHKLAIKAFKKANKARKRVLIAKDVLAQIKVGRYHQNWSGWFTLPDKVFDTRKDDIQIQKLLTSENIQSCQCCALGALFLSDVRMKNACTVGDVAHSTFSAEFDLIKSRLTKYFTYSQLKQIEIAYEQGRGRFIVPYLAPNNSAKNFGNLYDNRTDRLEAIMLNIIKNQGTFKPQLS